MVNENWKNKIHKQRKENNRTAILQLNPPNIKEPKKYTNPIYKNIPFHILNLQRKNRKIQKDFMKIYTD